LARFPENIYHHVPFKFVSDDVDEWLQNCGLYTETTRQLMRLIYSRGPTLCLSDMAVFGNLPPDEFRRLLKCLTRVRMVVARLRVSPDSDVEALVRYWGSWEGSPSRRIRPLIESLAKTPGGGTINVAQLLPPFARERLYSFPDRADAATTRQNCVWSTMNFGSEKPDDRFFDVSYTMEVLRREYAQTESEPVLGDLIGLMNGRGDFLHWCVHIADGLVFTKNGGEALQPWTLMRVSDILALYSLDEPLKATTFRRKRLST
jgi:hypothetical protein